MYKRILVATDGSELATKAVDHAIAAAPGGRLVVDDPELKMHTAEELKTELESGMRRDRSDLNPLRVFRERK